tara:strand:+ start:35684 stop:36067 length:384 start_codon:yes stop_codon:yes gene_type:complete
MEKDLNYIASMEKAISKKYGADAIKNPKGDWDPEKEKEYVEQLKNRTLKMQEIEEQSEKIEVKGFFMAKKLLNREVKIICSVCENKLRTVRDDIYMNKFDCCEKCYVDYVEGREERWLKGWRPNDKK